ncbi:unnamed protein product, partial [marine sediment metagenome]
GLIIGGDVGMAGAARMAGEACARVGAGLTTVATRPEHISAIVTARPELMAKGISETDTVNDLQALLNKASVIVLGPGLGQSNWSETLFKHVINTEVPMVVDADGLNLLAKLKDYHGLKKNNWILTPHPGEAARLLACTTAEIEKDRFAAVKQLQQKYDGVIILKGAGTLVCDQTQEIFVCDAGNPGMASGGMGDVLTGIITGLMAQHTPLADAAQLAVILHAKAADLAADEFGERGLLATDLFFYLRKLMNNQS